MSFDTEQSSINRQKAIAQALRDSGNFTPAEINRTASGGLVVPITPFQTVAKLLQTGLGAYKTSSADDAQDALNKQKDAAQQSQIGGLMDAITGPSQMGTPTDPNAPPIGATTNFDTGSGSAVPQQPSQAGASPVEQNQKRAALASILKGANPDDVISSLQGPAISQFMPKPNYTLKADELRYDGSNNKPIATGVPKEYKPEADDRSLVNIVDAKAPGGYRSIKRMDFKDGDQLWNKPNEAQLAAGNTGDMDVAVQYAITHDNQAPNWVGRSPARQAAFQAALGKYYKDTNNDAGSAQVASMQNKADQSSLTNIQKLSDNTKQARDTLEKNLTSLQTAYTQTGNAGTEWGNKVYRAWQTGTGDASLKAPLAYLQAVQKEYAKLQMNSFGNAMTSDAANDDARKVINDNFTRGGMSAVMDAMRGEAANRTGALEDTRQGILSRITERNTHGGKKPAGATTTPDADVLPPQAVSQLKEGFQTKFGNGQVWTLQNGKPVKVSP